MYPYLPPTITYHMVSFVDTKSKLKVAVDMAIVEAAVTMAVEEMAVAAEVAMA